MYFIIEIQNGEHLITTKETINEAESEYHRVLTAAAISNVETHACTVLNGDGQQILSQCYKHKS